METERVSNVTEQESREHNERDWTMALNGLDRAVEWIKSNRQQLISFHISIVPERKTGIRVSLGMYWHDDTKRSDALKILFAGKIAMKIRGDSEDRFTIRDEQLGISFDWSIYRASKTKKPEPEEVVI